MILFSMVTAPNLFYYRFSIEFDLNTKQTLKKKKNGASSRSLRITTDNTHDPPNQHFKPAWKWTPRLQCYCWTLLLLLLWDFIVYRKVFHWNEKRTFQTYFHQWKFILLPLKICSRIKIVYSEVVMSIRLFVSDDLVHLPWK